MINKMEEKISTTKSCGLCGKNKSLTKTPCCDQWICDDVHEGHKGNWKDCNKCKKEIGKTEMYVWYGTNEFNFEKLENPPEFKPTVCSHCKKVIDLGNDGYSSSGEGYTCMKCTRF